MLGALMGNLLLLVQSVGKNIVGGIKTMTIKPIYCRECHSRDNWKRDKSHDVTTESGKIFEYGWRCACCGATTITPNELQLKVTK